MTSEETRLWIKEQMYDVPTLKIKDMWYVRICYRNKMGKIEIVNACFERRFDAERFISQYWDNPCYVKMGGEDAQWNRIEELLGEDNE